MNFRNNSIRRKNDVCEFFITYCMASTQYSVIVRRRIIAIFVVIFVPLIILGYIFSSGYCRFGIFSNQSIAQKFRAAKNTFIEESASEDGNLNENIEENVEAFNSDDEQFSGRNYEELVIKTPMTEFLLFIEIADTPEKRAQGLMYRSSLVQESGMLFVFPEEGIRNFWMKNTRIPLDILFISAQKEIIGISRNAQPCINDICPHISSETPAQYVLELPGGFTSENDIMVGDSVKFQYPPDSFWLSCGSSYFR